MRHAGRFFLLLFSITALLTMSCGQPDERQDGTPTPARGAGPLRVVCTTTIIADLARLIGGPDVSVTALLDPGDDPHEWRPSGDDRTRAGEAGILFTSGLGLERRATDFIERVARNVPVTSIGDSIHPTHLIVDPSDPEAFDPHIWFDPAIWIKAAYIVRNALTAVDPEHREGYAARTDAFTGEIGTVTASVDSILSAVPVERRVVASTHDGFAYFARALRWNSLGPATARASFPGRVKGDPLVELVIARRIPVLFRTTAEPAADAEKAAREAAARGSSLRVVEGLLCDEWGPAGTREGTWSGAMKHNAEVLAAALR